MSHTLADLLARKATPREGQPALTDTEITPLLALLDGWSRDGNTIRKTYKLKDHYQTQAFTNAVMWVSHREDHHPELAVAYNTLGVTYSTHSVGGLSINDFICAARLDRLFAL